MHRLSSIKFGLRGRRWFAFSATLPTAIVLTYIYVAGLANVNGINGFELLSVPLLFTLVTLVSFGFWTMMLGLFGMRSRSGKQAAKLAKRDESASIAATTRELSDTCKTAILVPVYNESPAAVFARVQVMGEDLARHEAAPGFEFFVLSDTTKPEVWLQEELVWSELVEKGDLPVNVFYRRRLENTHRKAGNIAEFCERWGSSYEFMIVLDADSVMTASTMIEMVRRMRDDSHLGILQVAPRPVNRETAFARLQQFAAYQYGALCVRGFAAWAGDDGNYWGHNAIIRVQPFMQHCDLPLLPGMKPLGGQILSHDFVEAALMKRAGYAVRLATDLGGSYEECPTRLNDYLVRDQRWCQGNLQHFRLIFCEGFHVMSRLHFAMGVMCYTASLLWLVFIALTLLGSWGNGGETASSVLPNSTVFVFVAVMTMLLAPKFVSLFVVHDQDEKDQRSDIATRAASVILETGMSILMAPVFGYYHARFVLSTLSGKTVKWNSQQRSETGTSWFQAWRDHWDVMVFYGALLVMTLFATPDAVPWMLPLVVGPLLVVPLAVLLSDRQAGRFLKQLGLLVIPEEAGACRLLRRVNQLEAEYESLLGSGDDLFERVLTEPPIRTLHAQICRAMLPDHKVEGECLMFAGQCVEAGQISHIPGDDRRWLLADLEAIDHLATLPRTRA